MKTYKCLVNKDGSHSHQVLKTGVTAAEIAILRGVHGNDAVRSIRPCLDANGKPEEAMRLHMDDNGNDVRTRMNRTALLAILRRTYGEDMVAHVFPGLNPVLPMTVEDLGNVGGDDMEGSLIEDEMSDDDLEAATAPDPTDDLGQDPQAAKSDDKSKTKAA